jgi:glycosyltransferase involved in cell wall biosynthesis
VSKLIKPSVLVTFDSMKNANTGLYYFGLGLGNALLQENTDRFEFSFYLKFKNRKIFAGKVRLVFLAKMHKLFFPGRNKYNVVHFTDQFCRLKPQLLNARKILTIHDLNPIIELKDDARLLPIYFEALGRHIDHSDQIVAISQFVADDIAKHFPRAKGKLSVIYNGADKLDPVPGHQPQKVPQKKFLFTIGNVSPKKNFHVLPALLQGNDLQLVIAGTVTDYQHKIMEEAAKFNCANRIIITGPVSDADKAWYYQNCDALVFPSLAEGFGLPVIEAMYFGKPVFLSNLTSLPEIGGDIAYYFESFEPAAMQKVLAAGLDHFYKNNLAEAARQRAALFTWERTAQQYLALYQKA